MKQCLLIGLLGLGLAGCNKANPTTHGSPSIFTPKEILLGTIHLKDAETVVAFYETVTGIPRTNAIIAQEILVTRDFLPLAGKASEHLATTQRAYISLASSFCAQAVERQILLPAQGILFVGIDFSKNQAAFTQSVREMIIQRITQRAWGRNATDAELKELLLAMKDFESLPDSPAELKQLVTLMCTGMLSAADAIRM